MSDCNGLEDRSKGLDLILHTPGGDIAATESLVDYLHKMFDDIRKARRATYRGSLGTLVNNKSLPILHRLPTRVACLAFSVLRLESVLRKRRLNWDDFRRFIGGQAQYCSARNVLGSAPTEFTRWSA